MTDFEDSLWLEVVRKHGEELGRVRRRGSTQRRVPRPQVLLGTTAGMAALATGATLLLSASTSPPAFAVTRNPNGTVTVTLRELSGIARANEKLAAMGVRAQIVAPAKHPPKLVCPGGTVPVITFDPARIPKRAALVITPGQPGAAHALARKVDKTGSASSGNTAPVAVSRSGNDQVVRLYSGRGKIRLHSGAGNNHVARMACP